MEDNRTKIFRELRKLMKKYERPFIAQVPKALKIGHKCYKKERMGMR